MKNNKNKNFRDTIPIQINSINLPLDSNFGSNKPDQKKQRTPG